MGSQPRSSNPLGVIVINNRAVILRLPKDLLLRRLHLRPQTLRRAVILGSFAFPAVVLALQTPTPNAPTKPPEPLKHGSLSYYKDHCARCHGDLGGAYPDDFTKDKSTDALRDVVKSMAAGQGGSALTDNSELEAQVAFHYAIDLKRPFLDWTTQDGLTLKGEVTPDAKVTAKVGDADLNVNVAKGVWSVTVPNPDAIHTLVLKATLESAQTTLDLAKKSYSQAVPQKKT